MATDVEKGIAEAQRELEAQAPESLGLDELEAMPIGSAALEEVEIFRTIYGRRIQLEQAFIEAGRALLADGYPNLPDHTVSAGIMARLQLQETRMAAALKKFKANSMVSLGQTFEAPEKK